LLENRNHLLGRSILEGLKVWKLKAHQALGGFKKAIVATQHSLGRNFQASAGRPGRQDHGEHKLMHLSNNLGVGRVFVGEQQYRCV